MGRKLVLLHISARDGWAGASEWSMMHSIATFIAGRLGFDS